VRTESHGSASALKGITTAQAVISEAGRRLMRGAVLCGSAARRRAPVRAWDGAVANGGAAARASQR
jgi:hypothetical protein